METKRLFLTGRSRRFGPEPAERAKRKLRLLDSAAALEDLASAPGNRLERLHGDREGQHSIRINDQIRLCFRWTNGKACDGEITDYH